MGVANVPAASAAGLQPKYQKFTSSGTFTLPTGYGVSKPLLVNIQVIGGGGAGSPYSVNGVVVNANNGISASWVNYFGNNGVVYFNTDNNTALNWNANTGKGGGSGGLAQTQMYLTSNLTITVGAAGTRPAVNKATGVGRRIINDLTANNNFDIGAQNGNAVALTAGGSGGTSTAGSVSAGGGSAATGNFTIQLETNTQGQINSGRDTNYNITSIGMNAPTNNGTGVSLTSGGAGTPSGTVGDAVPLLGTIAGGSGSATAVFGSFGVGGIRNDGTTSTGVEGTGGGAGSIGASGAVILTWWE